MHRVVLVEDEYIVRFGIKSMIDWEKLGLTVSGEASNGVEALALIQENPPDILITDIKMPQMDGITLISEVRKVCPRMKIVILSNLEDFQYAKEAIRQGVSDYVIKSDMMPRDFESMLAKVKASIAEGAHAGGEHPHVAVEPLLREKLLLELIESGERSAESRKALAGKAAHTALKPPLCLLHVSKQAGEPGIRHGGESAIRQALAEVLPAYAEVQAEVFADRLGEVNVVLGGKEAGKPESSEQAWQLGEALLVRLRDDCALTATVGISRSVTGWTELPQAYEQAVAAAKYRMFIGEGIVIRYGVDYVGARSVGTEMIKISPQQIHAMVYAAQGKELRSYLEAIFSEMALRQDYELVQIVSLELLIQLTTLWADIASDPESVMGLKKQYYEQLAKLETLEQSKAWFMQAYESLIQHMIGVYSNDRTSILKAVQYMQMNYQQEMSLQAISNLVHLSKNYFANLFKKEMGESFLEHLTLIRIEKAKTLLASELKTADIGHLVGIPDPKYFSKVFKKITGVSPSEYRARVRGEA
ncbi:response regulator [Paenibacillus whitsoniae]|uniref:Response regulator n=1 Tax=Paenibacillus whitsoniae TaxID=2496558 RepID=A0A3S0C554_9BACL|nr:response regulator [Paenibacillus whitsoniae]RTE03078.1 response regulator [Paenibacillus whitsoniae]